MQSEIVESISKHMFLTEDEKEALAKYIPVKTYKKGTVLLEEGQVSIESYFNMGGCVRQYILVDGEERTTAFYTEGQSISSMTSYLQKTPSNHYLACVEDTKLAVLTFDNEQELYKLHPKFESLCRLAMEEDFGKQQAKLADYITKSPEERYLDLLKNQPELLNRVPQFHLASYLGVKPESLSRIRKRISLK